MNFIHPFIPFTLCLQPLHHLPLKPSPKTLTSIVNQPIQTTNPHLKSSSFDINLQHNIHKHYYQLPFPQKTFDFTKTQVL